MAAIAPQKFEDIIVAVHGIGQQKRYSTVRSVATQLAASAALTRTVASRDRPVAPQPLGYFHSDVKGITSVVLADRDLAFEAKLARIGFAEAFWADIPDKVLKEGDTLEETKAWGRTVVARAQALWRRGHGTADMPPDFALAAEVLDEIIESVYVLENLLFLAGKAGLFRFDLREVMESYLGDVQIFTEFGNYRAEIVWRFQRAMEDIYEQQRAAGNGDIELHIVAHSEGTVVSFLALLQALSGQRYKESGPGDGRLQLEALADIPEWAKHVHGYMTIGSPIDKHILLWPRLWSGLTPSFANGRIAAGQIKWRNYYDYGDPIGFRLETARLWLAQRQVQAFQFSGCPDCAHDIGFARYVLPGKAHNDYWDDCDVFEHFVTNVVAPDRTAKPAKPPADDPKAAILSPTLPYVVSFAVLSAGVYVLSKAVVNLRHPELDPLVKVLYPEYVAQLPVPTGLWQLVLNTFGISALIAGTTVLARMPRLAQRRGAHLLAIAAFAAGCALYALLVPEVSRDDIGVLFPDAPTLGISFVALLVGALGAVLSVWGRDGEDRRHRWVLKGMRPLVLSGAIAVACIVAGMLYFSPNGPASAIPVAGLAASDPERHIMLASDEEHRGGPTPYQASANAVAQPPIEPVRPLWPLALAAAAFVYLWWLATLVFDLAFVWHRYVRQSVAHDHLIAWGKAAGVVSASDGVARDPRCAEHRAARAK